jgi:DNA-directed RNA polymerase omega subunit
MAGGGVFGLARVAMLRAIEIHFGSPPLIEHAASDKETTIALNEIAQGRIGLKH